MDPFSLVVGTLTLVELCIKSSTLLHEAISGIKNSNRELKHLSADLGSLIVVLKALERNIKDETDTFDSLKIVLEACTQACDDLNRSVNRAIGDPKQPQEGLKVWLKLKRHGSDIETFKGLIDSYKATLTIAIADANLATTRVTKGLIEEYTELSSNAMGNLEERIEELSVKLELLHSENPHSSAEEKQAVEQKASLEQCLTICLKLIEHIHAVRPMDGPERESGTSKNVTTESSMNVPRMINDTLDVCTENLSNTAQRIREMADDDRKKAEMDEVLLLQQLGGVKGCLEVLQRSKEKRVNIFDNIEAAEDCRLITVSTIGDLIEGTNIKFGPRVGSVSGQMSDETVQKIVENFSPPGKSKPDPVAANTAAHAFLQRHGSGQKIR